MDLVQAEAINEIILAKLKNKERLILDSLLKGYQYLLKIGEKKL